MSFRLIAISGAGLVLAACTTAPSGELGQAGSLDAGFGETSKYNAAVQTIDSEPVYAAAGAQPGDNGEKGAAAVKRYRTDAVKDVESPTQGTGGQAGSGGGSGPR